MIQLAFWFFKGPEGGFVSATENLLPLFALIGPVTSLASSICPNNAKNGTQRFWFDRGVP